jgi:hypothetical protein
VRLGQFTAAVSGRLAGSGIRQMGVFFDSIGPELVQLTHLVEKRIL